MRVCMVVTKMHVAAGGKVGIGLCVCTRVCMCTHVCACTRVCTAFTRVLWSHTGWWLCESLSPGSSM